MALNQQKTPLARTLNRFAQARAADAIQLLGKALPASVVAVSGSIVTVKFELLSVYTLPQVTCPLFGPEYIRYPIQPGCLGVVFPADTYIGGVSGLGGGVADLTLPANLSALVFFPVGNANWTPPDDPNAVVIYGPDGAIIRDTGKKSTVTISPTGISMVTQGTVTINATENVNITGANINLNE